MLRELRPRSTSLDIATQSTVLEFASVPATARDTSGLVLFDANGLLVGIDLRDDAIGAVVMVGQHEDVATTATRRIRVHFTSNNELARVEVPDTRTRGAEFSIL